MGEKKDMTATGGLYLGVTPPISTAGPGLGDGAATQALVEALQAAGLFESEDESQLRYSPFFALSCCLALLFLLALPSTLATLGYA